VQTADVRGGIVDSGACVGHRAGRALRRVCARRRQTARVEARVIIVVDECVVLTDDGTAITASFTEQLV